MIMVAIELPLVMGYDSIGGISHINFGRFNSQMKSSSNSKINHLCLLATLDYNVADENRVTNEMEVHLDN